MKSHLFTHLLLVIFLAVIGGLGIWRIQGHLSHLQQTQDDLNQAMNDSQQLEKLHVALIQLQTAWEAAARAPDPAAWQTYGQTYQRWRNLVRSQVRRNSLLRDSVVFHQLQLLVESEQRRLSQSPDKALQPPPRLLNMVALWSDLNREANRRLSQLSSDILDRRGEVVLEATLIFVAFIMAVILYMFAVNAYLGRPVQELAETARAVRRGDLAARVVPRGDGPVRQLANDFNRMVDLLVASLDEEERVVEELKRKTRQLEEANRHKSQFLANISHELKTPLNAIIGFADILDSGHHGELAPRQQDYVRRVGQAGRHLLAMISDLIDLAKLDIGALRLEYTTFDVQPLLTEVGEMMAPQLGAKQHELTLHCSPGLTAVMLDRQRLKQILLNLLSNAIKFTPPKGHLQLQAEQVGDQLVIHAIDDGIGLSTEEQSSIFEDFVQVDSRLQRQHEGTGIGLALCRRLAAMMQGTLGVDSEPDQGSTFTLRLPIHPPPESAAGSAAESSAGPASTAPAAPPTADTRTG